MVIITRINSLMNQLILPMSAGFGTTLPSLSRLRFGYPASRNAVFHVSALKPSTEAEPIFRFTFSPALGTLSVLNDTPSFVTRSWARSQFENLVKAVTKTWDLQVAPSAVTVTKLRLENVSRSGLA